MARLIPFLLIISLRLFSQNNTDCIIYNQIINLELNTKIKYYIVKNDKIEFFNFNIEPRLIHNKIDSLPFNFNEYRSEFRQKSKMIQDCISLKIDTINPSGIIEIGNIMYFNNCMYAMVYFGYQFSQLNGSGNIYVFRFINGAWNLVNKINIWVS